MRMVSNKHVTSSSMKRFKRVHVLHKAYVAKPASITEKEESKPVVEEENVEKTVIAVEPPVLEELVVPEVVDAEVPTEEAQEEVLAAPKPKTRRKKKVVETEENNEEKPEDNG